MKHFRDTVLTYKQLFPNANKQQLSELIDEYLVRYIEFEHYYISIDGNVEKIQSLTNINNNWTYVLN